MLKRLLIVTLCILSLPALASLSHGKHQDRTGPFAVVVFAGHSGIGGAYCTCGCPDCVCDPGETTANCALTSRAVPQPDNTTPRHKTPTGNSDYGTGMLVLALAFFVWLRLRA